MVILPFLRHCNYMCKKDGVKGSGPRASSTHACHLDQPHNHSPTHSLTHSLVHSLAPALTHHLSQVCARGGSWSRGVDDRQQAGLGHGWRLHTTTSSMHIAIHTTYANICTCINLVNLHVHVHTRTTQAYAMNICVNTCICLHDHMHTTHKLTIQHCHSLAQMSVYEKILKTVVLASCEPWPSIPVSLDCLSHPRPGVAAAHLRHRLLLVQNRMRIVSSLASDSKMETPQRLSLQPLTAPTPFDLTTAAPSSKRTKNSKVPAATKSRFTFRNGTPPTRYQVPPGCHPG